MNFAKKELEKYGWKEGKGLGKNENGINSAVRSSLKFDTCGIGYDKGKEITDNWWDRIYAKSLKNVAMNSKHMVNNDSGLVKMYKPQTTDKKSKKYNNFLHTSTLKGNDITRNSIQIAVPQSIDPPLYALSDEKLFEACGQRTGHKSSRHGLDSKGKLKRIEKQEKLLLKQLKRFSIDDIDKRKKKLEKKLKKIKSIKNIVPIDKMDEDVLTSDSTSVSTPKHKKSKKKKKRVSWNETITEYVRQDTNTENNEDVNCSSSATVTSVRTATIKDKTSTCISNVVNTGSEHLDLKFAKSKTDIQEMIRKENRAMKRKLRRLRKSELSNGFLEKSLINDDVGIKRKNNIDEDFLYVNVHRHSKKKLKTSSKTKVDFCINEVTDSFNNICIKTDKSCNIRIEN